MVNFSIKDGVTALFAVETQVANFINGTTPRNATGAWIQDNARWQCEAFARAPSALTALTTTSTAVIQRVCEPYLNSLNYQFAELAQSQGFGGQCAGVTYDYGYTFRVRNSSCVLGEPSETFVSNNPLVGPIDVRNDTSYSQGAGAKWAYCVDANGKQAGFVNLDILANSPTCGNQKRNEFVSCRFVARTGQVTNCGNTAPEVPETPRTPPVRTPPSGDPQDPPPEPYEDEDGDVIIPIPPYTGPGGPIELPPFVIPTSGYSGEPPSGPIGEGTPQAGQNTEGEGNIDAFPPPESGTYWIGAYVELSADSLQTGLITSSIPNDIYPRIVGNARLASETESGFSLFETPVDLRQKQSTLITADESLIVLGVFVNVLPGIEYTVTPLYRSIEPQLV